MLDKVHQIITEVACRLHFQPLDVLGAVRCYHRSGNPKAKVLFEPLLLPTEHVTPQAELTRGHVHIALSYGQDVQLGYRTFHFSLTTGYEVVAKRIIKWLITQLPDLDKAAEAEEQNRQMRVELTTRQFALQKAAALALGQEAVATSIGAAPHPISVTKKYAHYGRLAVHPAAGIDGNTRLNLDIDLLIPDTATAEALVRELDALCERYTNREKEGR